MLIFSRFTDTLPPSEHNPIAQLSHNLDRVLFKCVLIHPEFWYTAVPRLTPDIQPRRTSTSRLPYAGV